MGDSSRACALEAQQLMRRAYVCEVLEIFATGFACGLQTSLAAILAAPDAPKAAREAVRAAVYRFGSTRGFAQKDVAAALRCVDEVHARALQALRDAGAPGPV